MYVEASTRAEGQTANLISTKYQGRGEQCVEFYYHMYGRDMGTLNVYTPVGTLRELHSHRYTLVDTLGVEFYYHMYGRDMGTLNVYTPV